MPQSSKWHSEVSIRSWLTYIEHEPGQSSVWIEPALPVKANDRLAKTSSHQEQASPAASGRAIPVSLRLEAIRPAWMTRND